VCTGVDIAENQIAYAKTLAAQNAVAVTFLRGDIEDLHMIDAERFDIAISAFAFCWAPDLPQAFRETCRILRPDGRFVFSLGHPFYHVFGDVDETF
jgi:ubiquinone/menaquinone biosynthesis C-methylase UbiE